MATFYTIKLRRGLSTDWTAVNPILAEGETGWELDTRNFKQGDGTTAWNDLPYIVDENDRLPDVSAEDDNKILLTFGGQWVVADLPSGLPDPTGVPDGYMVATLDETWVVQAIPVSPDELPNPAGQPDGKILTTLDEAWVIGDPPDPGSSGAGGRTITGFFQGSLATATGETKFYNDSGSTLTIVSVRAFVTTAPSGSPIIIDVNKNDVSIFPTGTKPTIPAGQQTNKRTPDTTAWADGEYLTVDIDAVGSTGTGSNLTVQIEVA